MNTSLVPKLVASSLSEPRPLRIALVTEYYYPHLGGICEHVHFFAREARRLGHHVDIITSHLADAQPAPGVIRLGRSMPVYANGSQARVTIGTHLRRDMRRTLREGRYDIVHVHSPLAPALPLLAIEEAEVPVIGTFHTYFDHSIAYRVFRRYFQRRLDMLAGAIAVSQSTIVAMARYFDADWKIIPNGIDTDLFRPDVARPVAMRRDVANLLFLGRFDPRNGLATTIDAFKRVRGRGRRAQLVVVGDGPLRNYYRKHAGADPDITFVGPVLDGRPGYYAHASAYVCPTTKASFGITLLEAMASETAIVCSDILGFRDVVAHDREALMVPSGDRDSLANAMVHLLDDEGLRIRLGETGRARAAAYDWRNVTAMVLAEYRRVLPPVRSIGARRP